MLELIGALLIIYLLYLLVKWIITSYVGIIHFYYHNLAMPVFLMIGGIAAITVLISFIRAYYECFSRTDAAYSPKPDTVEPAFKSYFFHQGYKDYASIIKRAWTLSVVGIFKWGWKIFAKQMKLGFFAWIFLPFTLPMYAAIFAGVIFSVVPFIAISLLHTLVLAIILFFVMIISLFLNIVERVSMLWRSLRYVCPHAGCYQRVSLPIFVCPACGAWHRKLIPGKYGVFRRKCQCGKLIPTSSLTGRNKLPMVCPNSNCNKPLHNSIGSAPSYHFAVLGEPSSGKTSYLYALIYGMLDITKLNWFQINNDSSKKIYELFRKDYKQGILPLKTVQKLPDSLILKSSPEHGNGLFYFYDPAGEYYLSDADTINQGSYQQYLDGVFFIIDPFSLPTIRSKCTKQDLEQAGAAAGEYLKVYEKLVNYMRSTYNEKLLHRVPVSVIITKGDMIHSNPLFKSPIFNFSETQLKEWLMQNGMKELISAFSVYFNPELVKFHAVSAFGHDPNTGAGKPFSPINVINPYSWLLKNNSLNPETGFGPNLKMKSEFVGNSLGFVTAASLFFVTFSLLSGPVMKISESAPQVNLIEKLNVAGLQHLAGTVIPYKTDENLVYDFNPSCDIFADQTTFSLVVSKPSEFHLEGVLSQGGESRLHNDQLLIIERPDIMHFDTNNLSFGKFVKDSYNAYRVSADFFLKPGTYTVYFIPAAYRNDNKHVNNFKFRKKHQLWRLKMWRKDRQYSSSINYDTPELNHAMQVGASHRSVKKLIKQGYTVRRHFLKEKPNKKPILYLFLTDKTDPLPKTVIITLSTNFNYVTKLMVTKGDAFDFN